MIRAEYLKLLGNGTIGWHFLIKCHIAQKQYFASLKNLSFAWCNNTFWYWISSIHTYKISTKSKYKHSFIYLLQSMVKKAEG